MPILRSTLPAAGLRLQTERRLVLSSNTSRTDYATIDAVAGCEITRTPEDVDYQIIPAGLLNGVSIEYIRRRNGVDGSMAGCNPERFLQHYSINGKEATGLRPGSSTVIRESVFTEADNPALLEVYPTYRDYLLGEHMLQYPSVYGAMRQDGRENTSKIGRLRFVDIHGESVARYPAAAAALDYGIAVEGAITGLEAGAWWLPSVDEIYLLMHDRVLASADRERDPVNRTLSRLGKATCYGAGYSPWTSCEGNSYYAFFYNGSAGRVSATNKYGVYSVRPVSAL